MGLLILCSVLHPFLRDFALSTELAEQAVGDLSVHQAGVVCLFHTGPVPGTVVVQWLWADCVVYLFIDLVSEIEIKKERWGKWSEERQEEE